VCTIKAQLRGLLPTGTTFSDSQIEQLASVGLTVELVQLYGKNRWILRASELKEFAHKHGVVTCHPR
jgi:hypothetical protein